MWIDPRFPPFPTEDIATVWIPAGAASFRLEAWEDAASAPAVRTRAEKAMVRTVMMRFAVVTMRALYVVFMMLPFVGVFLVVAKPIGTH